MAMDYDLWWRIFRQFGELIHVDNEIALKRIHDETKTRTRRKLHYQEAIATIRKHHGSVPLKWRLAWPLSVWWRSRLVVVVVVVLRVSLRTHGSGLPLAILLMFKNKYGQIIFSTGTRQLGVVVTDGQRAGIAVFEFELDMMLEAGLYFCKVVCTDQASGSDVGVREDSGWIGPVQISWNYEEKQPPFFGMFGLPVRSRGLRHESLELA